MSVIFTRRMGMEWLLELSSTGIRTRKQQGICTEVLSDTPPAPATPSPLELQVWFTTPISTWHFPLFLSSCDKILWLNKTDIKEDRKLYLIKSEIELKIYRNGMLEKVNYLPKYACVLKCGVSQDLRHHPLMNTRPWQSCPAKYGLGVLRSPCPSEECDMAFGERAVPSLLP